MPRSDPPPKLPPPAKPGLTIHAWMIGLVSVAVILLLLLILAS